MQKTTYYWLGFTSAIAPLPLVLLLALAGNTERGSGRIDFTEFKVASAAQETSDNGTQTKGDRPPERPGRKD